MKEARRAHRRRNGRRVEAKGGYKRWEKDGSQSTPSRTRQRTEEMENRSGNNSELKHEEGRDISWLIIPMLHYACGAGLRTEGDDVPYRVIQISYSGMVAPSWLNPSPGLGWDEKRPLPQEGIGWHPLVRKKKSRLPCRFLGRDCACA